MYTQRKNSGSSVAMCDVLLPLGVNPIAVKYIYIYISYCLIVPETAKLCEKLLLYCLRYLTSSINESPIHKCIFEWFARNWCDYLVLNVFELSFFQVHRLYIVEMNMQNLRFWQRC
jgi:hypothetical protein